MDVPWTVQGHIARLNCSVWLIQLADSSESHNSQVGLFVILFQSTTADHTACDYYGKIAKSVMKKLEVIQHF